MTAHTRPRTRTTRAARVTTAVVAAGAAVLAPTLLAVTASAEDGPVDAGIFVEKVDGLPADFAAGVDVSSILSLEASGTVFRDEDGQVADLFDVLADHDVTYVRVRVWNDPYDADGNGYGGGTVDVPRAVEIGRRATAAGMRVLVDFHYSDFWADPAKVHVPKAWADLDPAQRATAAGEFTQDALQDFEDAGVDVGMVQVGNESNNGIAGISCPSASATVTSWEPCVRVYTAGAAAVRSVFPDALVALHFTNPENGRYATYAGILDHYDVDYDVFASSWYPMWHGSLTNLTSVLKDVADTYGKKVMVAETSWASTLDNGDTHPNTVNSGSPAVDGYPVSVQGQAWLVRDVIEAVHDVGPAGIGVFYWEPAWLPVGGPADAASQQALWEEHGSGWASSFAGGYDDDAADWYGGSAWDNQALFAFDGTPLESLRVFRYARTGATTARVPSQVESPVVDVRLGDDVTLPTTVRVTYNDGSVENPTVAWSGAVAWIRGTGTYTIPGITSTDLDVTATVRVTAPNLVRNGSFEDTDTSMWDASWSVATSANAIHATGDATDGTRALQFWAGEPFVVEAKQRITGVPAGTYRLSATVRGGGQGEADTLNLWAWSSALGDGVQEPVWLAGWSNPTTFTLDGVVVGADGTVEVGAYLGLSANAWGTLDAFRLEPVVTAPTVDRTALQAALDETAAVDRTRWTAASLAALDDAVAAGRVVLAAGQPTQADVDAVTDLVTGALDALQAIPTPTPTPTAPSPTPAPTGTPSATPSASPSASPATPASPAISVDRRTVRPGEEVGVTVTGVNGTQVEIGIASTYQRLATVPVSNGTATVTVTVPTTLAAGLHHLQVRDATGAVLAQVEIRVAGSALATTGADLAVPVALASALLALGLAADVVAARRRGGTGRRAVVR